MSTALLTTVGAFVIAAVTALGSILVARTGARATKDAANINRTTPAYTDLLEEVKGYRAEAKEDRELVKELEKQASTDRAQRRELELRVSSLEHDRDLDRSWIRRTIDRITTHDPSLLELVLPFPKWHTPADGIPTQLPR